MKKYLGCGSRQTPPEILDNMTQIAEHMAKIGWLLRSGGADGADMAFEVGCDRASGAKEIFLPWKHFNKSESQLYQPTSDAFLMASKIHPVWDKLSYGAKKLHARNVHQVLGQKIDEPVDLVICWTKNGKEIGGTATAIKLARQYNIKVINLANETPDLTSLS